MGGRLGGQRLRSNTIPQNFLFFLAGPAAAFLSSSFRSSCLLLSAWSAGPSLCFSSSRAVFSFGLSSTSSAGLGDTGAAAGLLPMAPMRLRGGCWPGASGASRAGDFALPPIWLRRPFFGGVDFGCGGDDGAGADSGSEAVSEPASLSGLGAIADADFRRLGHCLIVQQPCSKGSAIRAAHRRESRGARLGSEGWSILPQQHGKARVHSARTSKEVPVG